MVNVGFPTVDVCTEQLQHSAGQGCHPSYSQAPTWTRRGAQHGSLAVPIKGECITERPLSVWAIANQQPLRGLRLLNFG